VPDDEIEALHAEIDAQRAEFREIVCEPERDDER